MSQEEYLQTVASRVLYSRSCGAFYLSLLVASLTEIIWMLHPWVGHCCHLSYPRSPVFFAVEAYLSIGLFCETVLRLLWQRKRFWSDRGNVFDAVVSVLSMWVPRPGTLHLCLSPVFRALIGRRLTPLPHRALPSHHHRTCHRRPSATTPCVTGDPPPPRPQPFTRAVPRPPLQGP